MKFALKTVSALALTAGLAAAAQADQVFADDLIVQGSACIGIDCVNGEGFNFDTIRLKENNTRIAFNDTSSSASFPDVDWELQANESSNGGQNRFAIIDTSNSRTSFIIEANSPNNALYVDNTGRIGMGTNTPAVQLHVRDGNSPALRLEQDGSDGFASQSWDVAGNETNFFIRDVTNASKLPFKIKPNAPTDSLFMAADGNIGLANTSPQDALHITRTDLPGIRLDDSTSTYDVRLFLTNDQFRISHTDGAPEFRLDTNGDLQIEGSLTTGGTTCGGGGCDVVFTDDFDVPVLSERVDQMWSLGYLPAVGPTIENAPFNITDKTTSMLHELELAHIYIGQLHARLEALEAEASEG